MKKILSHLAVFCATLICLWTILILSSCIPNTAIKDNMVKSAVHYNENDPFAFGKYNTYNSVADNYADSILLNVLWNIKSNSPFVSSIDTKYYNGEDYGENWGLYQSLNGTAPNTDYTRYWHGSVAFIRPLLVFTDVNGVRNISFAVLIILVAMTLFILMSQKHYFAAAALCISMIGIQFWNIRLSLEYIPAFMVCFSLCPFYIILEKKNDCYLTLLSVIGGVMIAFFDFLTVETISLLVPLVLVFIVRADDNRLGNFKENFLLSAKCGFCWVISYTMTFIVKWSAASAITGENKFITALSAAEVRLYDGTQMPLYKQIPSAILANLSTIFGGTERIKISSVILGITVTALIMGSIFLLFRKKEKNISATFTLLIMALIPYIRYMVLNNHSYLHEFFTYRAQITVILCLLAILWYNTELCIQPKKVK